MSHGIILATYVLYKTNITCCFICLAAKNLRSVLCWCPRGAVPANDRVPSGLFTHLFCYVLFAGFAWVSRSAPFGRLRWISLRHFSCPFLAFFLSASPFPLLWFCGRFASATHRAVRTARFFSTAAAFHAGCLWAGFWRMVTFLCARQRLFAALPHLRHRVCLARLSLVFSGLRAFTILCLVYFVRISSCSTFSLVLVPFCSFFSAIFAAVRYLRTLYRGFAPPYAHFSPACHRRLHFAGCRRSQH